MTKKPTKPKTPEITGTELILLHDMVGTCGGDLRKRIHAGEVSHVIQALATLLLVNLGTLLNFMDLHGERYSATNDINPESGAKDVHHLILNARAAACHGDSALRSASSQMRMSFIFVQGKRIVVKTRETTIQTHYEDDEALIFGQQVVYLGRHLLPAWQATSDFLARKLGTRPPMLPNPPRSSGVLAPP